MPKREMHIGEVRKSFADVLAEVEGGTRVLLRRYKAAAAAIVPLSDYLALSRLDAHYASSRTLQEGAMQRIVITNISGGEGKSTLARELAYLLQHRGYRVALVDSDPQASLTKSLGLHDQAGHAAFQAEYTILPVFQTEDHPSLGDPLEVGGVSIWVSNDHLLNADPLISGDLSKQGHLREAIDRLEGQFDFVLIDTKPGITPLLNAAVAAADHIVVPVSGDKGMENLNKLARLIKAAEGFSPNIKVRLFVPNRQRAQTVLSKVVMEDLKDYEKIAAISEPIRDSIKVGEAYRMRQPLIAYAPGAEVTRDFQRVLENLLLVLGISQLETTV